MDEDRKDEAGESAEGYRKIDMRAGREEADEPAAQEAPEESPLEPEAPPEASQEPAEGEEQPAEASAGAEEPTPTMDTYGLLRLSLGMFVEQAWIEMGVQLAPGARELKADLHQAKLAIDAVNFLKEALADDLTPDERREVDQLLTMLRTNYVQRM